GQRISGALDWYTKTTSDLIFTVPVPAGTNFTNLVTTNVGTMRNRGIELSVNAKILEPRAAEGLGWAAGFTISHNGNELLSINPSHSVSQINVGPIGGGTGNTIQVLMPGQPINSFFVCQQFYQNGRPVQNTSVPRMDTSTLGCSFQYGGRPWRAYATVQNAFTITGYDGVDPTAGLNGLDNNIYPRSRTLTGGLSVRF